MDMRQIGERFVADDGTLVEVVEHDDYSCRGCHFVGRFCANKDLECRGSERPDEKIVIFKKVEL